MIYQNIEDMTIDMCLLRDELRNKKQEYNIMSSDNPTLGKHRLGFVIWWEIRDEISGLVIEEVHREFKIEVTILDFADTLTKTIFRSSQTRDAFIHCLKNNNYPIEKEKILARQESNRIINKGW